MTNLDLSVFTLDELVALEAQIKLAKVAARTSAKESAAQEKADRIAHFKGNVKDGDTISFLYGRENVLHEGTVVRASEKSVTVKSIAFGEKAQNYVRYDRIVEILASAPVQATENDVAEAFDVAI